MSNIIKIEEFEDAGSLYVREIYDNEAIVEYPKPKVTTVTKNPTSKLSYQPTNAEVAQMISDLQADLIIAGVI